MSDLEKLAQEYNQRGYESNGYPEALEAEVERLTADPRMALTADDLRWAAKRASGESLYEHVNDPNGDGEAVYARRANRFRAALADEKGDERELPGGHA